MMFQQKSIPLHNYYLLLSCNMFRMPQFNYSVLFEVYCNEILTKREQSLKFLHMAADMQRQDFLA